METFFSQYFLWIFVFPSLPFGGNIESLNVRPFMCFGSGQMFLFIPSGTDPPAPDPPSLWLPEALTPTVTFLRLAFWATHLAFHYVVPGDIYLAYNFILILAAYLWCVCLLSCEQE